MPDAPWWKKLFPWVFALPAPLLVLFYRVAGSGLLADSDTGVLLSELGHRHSPLSWFLGDWPLGNHFYRPLPTLLFEFDRAIYGSNAAGYGWTNAILCGVGIVALLFFAAQIVRPWPAIAATWLFTAWTLGLDGPYGQIGLGLAAIALIVGALRKRLLLGALSGLALYAFPTELYGVESIFGRTVAWLPGRTATTCTIFALLALGCYARSLLAAPKKPVERIPLDPPATRNTVAATSIRPQPWFLASVLFTVLALASYEQAVMVPALMFGVAAIIGRDRQVRFAPQMAHWGVLVAYLVFRAAIIPTAASGYQKQQFRAGPGVLLSAFDYISPNLRAVTTLRGAVSVGWEGLLIDSVPRDLALVLGFAALWIVVAKRPRWTMAALLVMSFLAFLPMAFLKPFEHYHHLPMAIRSIFVVVALGALADASRRATSLRAVQAPARSRPAPGSLPHL